MSVLVKTLAAVVAASAIVTSSFAQSARDIRGPAALVAIRDEAQAKLIADPAIPEQLGTRLTVDTSYETVVRGTRLDPYKRGPAHVDQRQRTPPIPR